MDNQPKKPVAVVIGAGPGLGASLIRRFAKTYSVAMLARKARYLAALAGEIQQSGAAVQELTCDVSDRTQIAAAFRAIREELGDPEVLLYNAGSGVFGTITEITPDQYEADWRVNSFGAFVAAKEVAPAMIARSRRFFVRARQVRTGLAQTASLGRWANCKDTTRAGMSGVVSRWLRRIETLPEIAIRLLRVQIKNRPANEMIRLYDSERILFYCDPPYPHETRGDSKAYGFEMTDEDHRKARQAFS
ncbi:MAG TPA: SDR family NAD(P)-dependent oxidoreductase [Candidatus Binataceae bacterium]|nr:SDR family NAD(P)-dependent oxidoreductase [Candidatus Binataceae bacterium]